MEHEGLGGGTPHPLLHCTFFSPVCSPSTIKLPLGIGGVSWTYTLNHKVEDTIGGQVIQILGVSIDNLTIRGNFATPDPHWGIDANGKPRDKQGWDSGREHIAGSNGIRQMADWFRSYFESTTQGAFGQQLKASKQRYQENLMVFEFPARGWKFQIRPTAFPNILVDTKTNNPEWVVNADFVEDLEINRSFIDNVTEQAYAQFEGMREGIGFQHQNPFSAPLNSMNYEESITSLLKGWEDSIWNNFSDEEIDIIVNLGYSYPAAAMKAAGWDPRDFMGSGSDPTTDEQLAGEIANVAKELQKWFLLNALLDGEETNG